MRASEHAGSHDPDIRFGLPHRGISRESHHLASITKLTPSNVGGQPTGDTALLERIGIETATTAKAIYEEKTTAIAQVFPVGSGGNKIIIFRYPPGKWSLEATSSRHLR